jgi:hypothetical protein
MGRGKVEPMSFCALSAEINNNNNGVDRSVSASPNSSLSSESVVPSLFAVIDLSLDEEQDTIRSVIPTGDSEREVISLLTTSSSQDSRPDIIPLSHDADEIASHNGTVQSV